MKGHTTIHLLAISAGLLAFSSLACSQASMNPAGTIDASETPATISVLVPPDAVYIRPGAATKLGNYVMNAFGPEPIVGSALVAAFNQVENTPPEWGQGAAGYGKRFGSNLGIAAVSTTTRYGLAEAFRQDTLYYRCECRGLAQRMDHALLSTLYARRGNDGHRIFSIPSLVAPYAGTMTAVYGWYPNRFGAVDGFRMGNYNLLSMAAENIAMEFFPRNPHSLLFRMHLNNRNEVQASK